ncbi:MAG: phospholipid carrier-dependent glycosyltransferase [Candidatus Korobacteraceae bacterium]
MRPLVPPREPGSVDWQKSATDRRRWDVLLPALIAVLSVFVATLLIVHTYSVFSQTFDEGEHVAAGMEWLDTGSYSYDPLNPPLARIAVALGPYLDGARSQGNPNVWNEANAILEYQGHYQRTLTLARLGILPFFWLACFVLWRFMVRYYGRWPAALAVVFFVFCPPVLANASVATTDLAFTAMFFWAFLCFWNFLQAPKLSSAILAGLTIGLALLAKLSGLSYLAVAGLALYVYALTKKQPAPSWKYFGVASLTLVLIIWAGYRFSVGPILHEGQVRSVEAAELSKLPPAVAKVFFFRWVPAPEFFKGLAEAFGLSTKKRIAYLFGQTYFGGRWYFFPVAIAVKTPIPFLLLAILGAARAFVRPRLPGVAVPLIGIAGPLFVAMVSPVNLGLRHILVIYPFLAMLAALGFFWLWQVSGSRRKTLAYQGAAAILVVWSIVTCFRAAPDFIPYFNELAAPYASSILIDSDFDWGQDLKRLSAVLQQQHVDSFWVAYEGSANLKRPSLGLPPWQPLQPNQKPSGWIAISEFNIRTRPEDFGWLGKYKPQRTVGKTIRLYHFNTAPAD